jgi:hypothetical protein
MKSLGVMSLVAASLLVVHFASGATVPDRPAGVEARNWIPVSGTLGFVVVAPDTPMVASRDALLLMPPAEGYFMAKTGSGWRRLVIVEPVKGPAETG